MLGLDNPIHIAFLLILLLLVFGAKRLPEMGRSMGSGLRGFKDALTGEESADTPAPVLAEAPEPVLTPAEVHEPVLTPAEVHEPVLTPAEVHEPVLTPAEVHEPVLPPAEEPTRQPAGVGR